MGRGEARAGVFRVGGLEGVEVRANFGRQAAVSARGMPWRSRGSGGNACRSRRAALPPWRCPHHRELVIPVHQRPRAKWRWQGRPGRWPRRQAPGMTPAWRQPTPCSAARWPQAAGCWAERMSRQAGTPPSHQTPSLRSAPARAARRWRWCGCQAPAQVVRCAGAAQAVPVSSPPRSACSTPSAHPPVPTRLCFGPPHLQTPRLRRCCCGSGPCRRPAHWRWQRCGTQRRARCWTRRWWCASPPPAASQVRAGGQLGQGQGSCGTVVAGLPAQWNGRQGCPPRLRSQVEYTRWAHPSWVQLKSMRLVVARRRRGRRGAARARRARCGALRAGRAAGAALGPAGGGGGVQPAGI